MSSDFFGENMKTKMKIALPVLLVILAAASGCTAYQQGGGQQETPAADENAVNIQGFAFSPAEITIKKGSTVTWTQKDSVPHTVTTISGPEGFDSGPLSSGQSFSYAFKTAGTYEYYCSIHPNMKGKVIVTE